MAVVSISAVSAPGTPDRVNEDGWVAVEDRVAAKPGALPPILKYDRLENT